MRPVCLENGGCLDSTGHVKTLRHAAVLFGSLAATASYPLATQVTAGLPHAAGHRSHFLRGAVYLQSKANLYKP